MHDEKNMSVAAAAQWLWHVLRRKPANNLKRFKGPDQLADTVILASETATAA
jgi:hypothetical protein